MNMIIKRDKYLDELIGWKHTDLIKIVTGLRRCGKSFLLFNLFHQHLLSVAQTKATLLRLLWTTLAMKH